MCVVWGEDDRVIPVSHAARAAELAPKARVEVIPNAGHFPHKDHPERFVKVLNDFVRTTRPATYSRARWRRLLQQGPAPGTPLEAVDAPGDVLPGTVASAAPAGACSGDSAGGRGRAQRLTGESPAGSPPFSITTAVHPLTVRAWLVLPP